MAKSERDHWVPTSDPVVYWPGKVGSLAAILPDLTRLNPDLHLRLITDENEDSEFLSYAGSALDVPLRVNMR